MTTKKAAVVLSGGMDSATLLAHLLDEGNEVRALTFDYGQRHRREIDAARAIASHYGVRHDVLDLTSISSFIAGSSALLGKQEVPEGHYEDESMKATVVPNRNMILLSVAVGVAIAEGLDVVAYGAHAGDHAIYPDCRASFADALAQAVSLADWHPVKLLRPFVSKTKADIAALGARLGVPFALTWSCYKGGAKHCGECGTCVERREAFALAGVTEP